MYQIFIENYCINFIKKNDGINLADSRNRRSEKERLKNLILPDFNTISHLLPPSFRSRLDISLPTEILFITKLSTGSVLHNQVSNSFINLHGDLINVRGKEGLDELRNNIAHNGIGVKSTSEINNYIRGDFEQIISQWHKAFGLPSENVYVTANREVENFLRNN